MTAFPPQNIASAKASILVVDDDRTCGEALCHVLKNEGYAAALATDFSTALDLLNNSCSLDLLLVDIVMPGGVNGLALSRMAKMRRSDLKIVYLTGYHIPGADHEALGPILRKPVDNGLLIEEIARALTD